MKKILLIVLLAASPLFSADKAVLIGNNVNIRNKASLKGKQVARLKINTRVEILSKDDKKIFIGPYLGSWYKIKIQSGKQGYMLSSFLKEDGESGDKFHIFFKKFSKAVSGKDNTDLLNYMKFPLDFSECEEGNCTNHKLKISGVLNALGYFSQKKRFSYEKDQVFCQYGEEGSFYTLTFKKIRNRWTLLKIEVGRC